MACTAVPARASAALVTSTVMVVAGFSPVAEIPAGVVIPMLEKVSAAVGVVLAVPA